MLKFENYTYNHIQSEISTRAGEQKLGEALDFCTLAELESISAKYIILGISEDIGVRANYGLGGSHTTWAPFIKTFINIQNNNFIDPKHILILGEVKNEYKKINNETIESLRSKVKEIDDLVFPIIQKIIECGKIPIVIGGGHNNCYPIIKGVSKAQNSPIHVLNIDAHTDFRMQEGRHSGNGFKYAYEEKYLGKYAVYGIQQHYVQQYVDDEFTQNENLKYTTFETIQNLNFDEKLLEDDTMFLQNNFGLELDLDVVKNVLSSAMSPVGFDLEHIRIMIKKIKNKNKLHYLHICEGIHTREDKLINPNIGKLITQIVLDFIF